MVAHSESEELGDTFAEYQRRRMCVSDAHGLCALALMNICAAIKLLSQGQRVAAGAEATQLAVLVLMWGWSAAKHAQYVRMRTMVIMCLRLHSFIVAHFIALPVLDVKARMLDWLEALTLTSRVGVTVMIPALMPLPMREHLLVQVPMVGVLLWHVARLQPDQVPRQAGAICSRALDILDLPLTDALPHALGSGTCNIAGMHDAEPGHVRAFKVAMIFAHLWLGLGLLTQTTARQEVAMRRMYMKTTDGRSGRCRRLPRSDRALAYVLMIVCALAAYQLALVAVAFFVA